MKKIELLAVGDIVTDAFIRLEDAHVHCNINHKGCELCLRFGDKIPYEKVIVIPSAGNSPNASVAASRLGLSVALVSSMGDDENGQNCLENLKKENILTDFIDVEKGKFTNYHYVLWYEDERTILVRHQKYERTWPENLDSEEYSAPTWVYLSSLGEDSLPFHGKIISYLEKHPEIKLAFQPGTFQMKFGPEKLKEIYAHTTAFFCNKDEAGRILGTESEDLLELSRGIEALGPKMIFISDGGNGAYFYRNGELWYLPVFPNQKNPVERTGAGDAFAGTIVSALALGMQPTEAFLWGPINSMSVIQCVGAQEGLLSREKLLEYLKDAPPEYKPKKIN